jgi:outer membrane cobalamin receptor
MLKYLLLFIVFIKFCLLGFSQDTIKQLPEVSIVPVLEQKLKTLVNTQLISSKQIDVLQPEDIGVLLQKTSGTSVKSYGGLGGLKTVSVKGLNSQHTAFVQDGFLLQNAQTGQLNLGQIMVDNISEISLNEGAKQSFLLPVSAYTKGSLISISSKFNQFENKNTSASNFTVGVGSFGQLNTYLSSKYERNQFLLSSYLKYRKAEGDYPFEVSNGSQTLSENRMNNDLKDRYGGVTVAYQFKNKAEIRSITNFKEIQQGLPGAVILYNNASNQRLNVNQVNTKLDFTHFYKKLYYRIHSTYSKDKLNYIDPSFLNNSGGINTTYTNDFFDVAVSLQRKIKKIDTYGGIESKYNTLSFSTINSAVPERLTNLALIGGKYKFKSWTLESQVSGQAIQESNKNGEKAKDVFKVNPFFSLQRESLKPMKLTINAWYRNSFRMPTFNELYYNNIGNYSLNPEETNQFSLGVSMFPLSKKNGLKLVVNSFYNEVKNQILALPTKNLFVWSMQNIGKVKNYGFESRIEFSRVFKKDWKFNLSTNYTQQNALDISNSESPTFENQVAYMPKHSANFDVNISYKEIGLSSSLMRISKRYSLNENIVTNEVSGFTTLDLGFYFNHKMADDSALKLHFMVKNVLDVPYNYIRYFVMPGRNFLMTLSYAIR